MHSICIHAWNPPGACMIPGRVLCNPQGIHMLQKPQTLVVENKQTLHTVQHKTLANLELQENWWRKFWRLITLITVHYLNLQHLADKTLADC